MLIRKRIINKRNRKTRKKVIKIILNFNIGTINNIVNNTKMSERKNCDNKNSSIFDSSVNLNDSKNTDSYNITYSPENTDSYNTTKTEEELINDILYNLQDFLDEDDLSQNIPFHNMFDNANLEGKGQSSISQEFITVTSSNSDTSDSDTSESEDENDKKKRKITNLPQVPNISQTNEIVPNISQTNEILPVFVQSSKIILESVKEYIKILKGQKTLANANHYLISRLNYNKSREYDDRKENLRFKCIICNKKRAVYGCWLCALVCGLDFASRMHFCYECAGISKYIPKQGHFSWNPTTLENTLADPKCKHIQSAQAKFVKLKYKRDKIESKQN